MSDQYSSLSSSERQSIVSLCISAAFADGALTELERDEIKTIAQNFAGDDRDLTSAYQQALSGNVSLPEAAARLQSPNSKALAYEMALCICNVDQSLGEGEKKFLAQLRDALQLDPAATAQLQSSADQIREHPPVIAHTVPPAPEGVEEMIRDRAILAGALELLPQRLATMAIVPIQMRLVYQVGKAYGFDLDMGHAKEFFATVGLGLTSQMVDSYLTKIVGKVARRYAGRFAGALASQASESAIAFATTYAIGQAAKSYYGGGRTLSTTQLKELFSRMLSEGQAVQSRFASQISQRAGSLKISDFAPALLK